MAAPENKNEMDHEVMKQNGGNYAKVKCVPHNHHPSQVRMLARFIRLEFREDAIVHDAYLIVITTPNGNRHFIRDLDTKTAESV